MAYAHTVAGNTYRFDDLKTLLAKATPSRSGDQLAGVAAQRNRNGWPRAWRLPMCRCPPS